MTATPPKALDMMAIEYERRQTRPLAIKIELGSESNELNDDYLRVASISGQESVSQLYQFNVEVHANDNNPVDVADIDSSLNFKSVEDTQLAQGMGANLLGRWAQLRISMACDEDRFTHEPQEGNPDWERQTPSRFFAGIISSITHSSPGAYQLSLQSPLYPLTLRNRYTIHKDKSTEELLGDLLSPEMLSYNSYFKLQFKLQGETVARRQDWLQAGESDFVFLQRMLTKASIHFYFIHEKDTLILVFSNQTTSPREVTVPGCNNQPLKLRYSYTNIQTLGLQQDDLFCDLKYEVKMVQQAVRTVLTRQQPVWETNQVAKYTSYSDSNALSPQSITNYPVEYLRHRSYTYGVDDTEVESQVNAVCQQLATEEGTLSGTSTSPLLSPGYTFELEQPVESAELSAGRMPMQFSGRTFVVTKITHKASDKESYTGTVEATEVNITEDPNKETLITPFNMQGTQQGSVLAKVLQTAVPKDWRYRDKNNFQTAMSSVGFNEQVQRQMGCIVQFATDSTVGSFEATSHWVALSATSQTAPEVNAMVMVSRANNESEIPEIQQVISTHGQKTIQPPERRTNHWTASTSWGCNYSTSFGDGISIRYGNQSLVDLPQAIQIVENAYDNPGVLSTDYGNTSFNKGSSYSFSCSDNEGAGLSNASVSAGCNFSESHSQQNYNVSFTDCSQSYSKTNKSVNVSYQGTYEDDLDYENPSFIRGKIPEQSIIDISDAIPDGSSYQQSQVTGKSINLSATGTTPPTYYDLSATVYSHSITYGDVININEQTGNTRSESTTTGCTNSESWQQGDTESSNIHNGDSVSSSTHNGDSCTTTKQTGDTKNDSLFIGTKNDIQTNISATNSFTTNIAATNAIATNISATNNINTTIGVSNSIDRHIGAKNNMSTSIAASNMVSTNIAATNNVSTNISASNSVATNIGVSNNVSTNISASNTTSTTIGATNQTDTFIGVKNTTSSNLAATNTTSLFLGASNETSVKLAASNATSIAMGAANTTSMNLAANNTTNMNLGANNSTNINLGLNAETSIHAGIVMKTDVHGGVLMTTSVGSPAVIVDTKVTAKTSATKVTIVGGIECIL